ncbi:transposable element Tcb1 transposase [Trichonephila clavipes]|nr:transposable element Tcb1 transposase [Trichonephila clavipes]
MQEGRTDRRGRSHPPQCTTSREEKQIVRMVVTDHSITSRTMAQHIESVTHHSVSAHTIRRRLQQSGLSARRPLLGLPLKQNHRRLRRQWCDERRIWVAEWNEVVFTDESRLCRIQIWRHRRERMLNSCVMHRHTGPALGMMVWGGIGYHSRTPLLRTAEPSPIENMLFMVAQRLTQITPPAATPINFGNVWKLLGLLYPKNTCKVSESMPRRVAAVISNNGGYSGY